MKVLISIDDTDNLDSPGTGALAAEIARMIRVRNWGQTFCITRHQLYIHPAIPYTSHNSAMCFAADIDPACTETMIAASAEFLVEQSAVGSDPGLCVVRTETCTDPGALVGFGQAAKSQVLSKEDAYCLARRLRLHLSEHGGTGQGVIGALAGAGLRLSGNDGRMRGRLTLSGDASQITVKALREHRDIDAVQTLAGELLPDSTLINLGDKVKTVLLGGGSTLLVTEEVAGAVARWRTCSNQELKGY